MALAFAAPRHLATHWPHVSQTPPMVPDAFCRGFSLQTSRRFALCFPSDAFSLFRHFDHSLPSGSPLRSVQSLLRCVPRTSTTVCARPAAVPALMCSFSLASSHRSLRGLHFGILRLSHMLPSGERRRDARCFRVEVSGLAASDMAPALGYGHDGDAAGGFAASLGSGSVLPDADEYECWIFSVLPSRYIPDK